MCEASTIDAKVQSRFILHPAATSNAAGRGFAGPATKLPPKIGANLFSTTLTSYGCERTEL
jgi:hypothetical protein